MFYVSISSLAEVDATSVHGKVQVNTRAQHEAAILNPGKACVGLGVSQHCHKAILRHSPHNGEWVSYASLNWLGLHAQTQRLRS